MTFRIRGDADVTRSTNTVRANESLTEVTATGVEVVTSGKTILIPSSVTAGITRTLPAANGGLPLKNGFIYHYVNNSSATVTINLSGATQLGQIPAGRSARVTLLDDSTAPGVWKFAVIDNPTGSVTAYTQTFNATTDWGTANVAGFYTITVTQAVHLKGVDPIIQIEELISGSFQIVGISPIIDTSGNITFTSAETPDDRFAGRIVVL